MQKKELNQVKKSIFPWSLYGGRKSQGEGTQTGFWNIGFGCGAGHTGFQLDWFSIRGHCNPIRVARSGLVWGRIRLFGRNRQCAVRRIAAFFLGLQNLAERVDNRIPGLAWKRGERRQFFGARIAGQCCF